MLSRLDRLEERGIVTDSPVSLGFATQSRPVYDFPLWPRSTSPELALDRPLSPDADVVLLSRPKTTPYSDIIRLKMDDEFVACLEAALWTVYVRPEAGTETCDIEQPEVEQ